jgi:hypothetical protein
MIGDPSMIVPLTAEQRQLAAAMVEESDPDSLEAHVKRMMHEHFLWGYHSRNSIGARRGWPDWVILGPYGALFRELKTERGKLTVDQRKVGSMLTRAGLNWGVWRPADLYNGVILRQLDLIAYPSKEAA